MLELITVVMRCQRERQVNSVFVILTVRVFVGFRRLCSGFFFSFFFVAFLVEDSDFSYVCLGDF